MSENVDPISKGRTKLPLPSATKLPQPTTASRRSLEDRTNDINQMPPPPRGRSRIQLSGGRSNSSLVGSRSTSRESSLPKQSSIMGPRHKKANSVSMSQPPISNEDDINSRMQKVEQFMQRSGGEKEELLHAEIRRLKNEINEMAKLQEELDDVKQTLEYERENSHQLYNDRTKRLLDERDDRISYLEKALAESKDEFFHVTSDLRMQLAEKPAEVKQQMNEKFEKERLHIKQAAEEEVKERHNWEMDKLRSDFDREMDKLKTAHEAELESLKDEMKAHHESVIQDLYHECDRQFQERCDKLSTDHQSEMKMLKHAADEKVSELEDEISKLREQLQQAELQFSQEKTKVTQEHESWTKEKKSLLSEIDDYKEKLDSEKHETETLRTTLSELTESSYSYASINKSQQDQLSELQYQLQAQKDKVSELRAVAQEAENERDVCKDKLLKEEFIRRKLHNQIQELKGNIRVFCRVRPKLKNESYPAAEIQYPDVEGQEILLSGPSSDSSSLPGSSEPKLYRFNFDRVFSPDCNNDQVFDEISQLVQSALDGYNVCIFAYGQTGSGKTYTMSSPRNGMISRAINQIFQTCDALKEKGWTYRLEGQFLEIYNENLNDLLGKPDMMDKSKLEIRHDDAKAKTSVTNLTVVDLDSPEKVEFVLKKAWDNRSVAATKVNERSSRSHSVFILKLIGENTVTGDKSEGVLNLIDLAGSERLSQSQAAGDRLKETQSINKSLSSLGDVIQALGGSKDHVPYRNSKLTYLLKHSLSGNSKTLMFVNMSPLEPHINESLSSLRFATKVNNTQLKKVKS